LEAYFKFQKGLDQIGKSEGSLSYHHGLDRMISKWMPRHLGDTQLDILRVLKGYFDSNNIMNSGASGLSLNEEE